LLAIITTHIHCQKETQTVKRKKEQQHDAIVT